MTLLTRREIELQMLAETTARPTRGSGRRTSGPPARPAARAVACLQPGSIAADRQMTLILSYVETHGYALVGVVRWPATPAVQMIAAGEADLVVAAYGVKSGGVTSVEADIAELGARVEYCREPVRRMRRQVDDLAERMLAEGLDPALVCRVLDLPPDQMRIVVADRQRRPGRIR